MKEKLTQLSLFLGPLLSLIILALMWRAGFAWPATITAAITTLCAVWWIFEPVPIPATSLIPMAAFPMFGVLNGAQVASAYGHWLILLLLGGFILSTALEKSGTHKRLAIGMIKLVGGRAKQVNEKRIILGFMVASAVLSMWISNTATTLMLLPVAIAIIQSSELQTHSENSNDGHTLFATALILGLGYAASVGGMGTPIGTPPNTLFMNVYAETTGKELAFSDWMKWAVPIVVIMIPIMWLWLTRNLSTESTRLTLPKLGQWRAEEKRTLIVFLITALLWIFRKEPFGGWSGALGLTTVNDASVALMAVVAMFLIPNGKIIDGQKERLLDWPTANRIPWGVLLLFAGGITIAKAFTSTGLSDSLGQSLAFLSQLPPILTIITICLLVTFLTELTSNTATTALLMPVLAAAGQAANIDPALFMVPAAISASCAFMLPVATGPNAVIFASERLTVEQMVRNGFVLNLLGVLVVSGAVYLLVH
ncbi:MAG: SLC13/DASS family transporter [Kangiellaceae bacterium]|nr:SLC13/DASS family transporter [Kangiellaceae bacterium]